MRSCLHSKQHSNVVKPHSAPHTARSAPTGRPPQCGLRLPIQLDDITKKPTARGEFEHHSPAPTLEILTASPIDRALHGRAAATPAGHWSPVLYDCGATRVPHVVDLCRPLVPGESPEGGQYGAKRSGAPRS